MNSPYTVARVDNDILSPQAVGRPGSGYCALARAAAMKLKHPSMELRSFRFSLRSLKQIGARQDPYWLHSVTRAQGLFHESFSNGAARVLRGFVQWKGRMEQSLVGAGAPRHRSYGMMLETATEMCKQRRWEFEARA